MKRMILSVLIIAALSGGSNLLSSQQLCVQAPFPDMTGEFPEAAAPGVQVNFVKLRFYNAYEEPVRFTAYRNGSSIRTNVVPAYQFTVLDLTDGVWSDYNVQIRIAVENLAGKELGACSIKTFQTFFHCKGLTIHEPYSVGWQIGIYYESNDRMEYIPWSWVVNANGKWQCEQGGDSHYRITRIPYVDKDNVMINWKRKGDCLDMQYNPYR